MSVMFVHRGDRAGPEVYGFLVTLMLSQHAAQQDIVMSLMWRPSRERAQPKKKLVKSKFVIFSPLLRNRVRLGPRFCPNPAEAVLAEHRAETDAGLKVKHWVCVTQFIGRCGYSLFTAQTGVPRTFL